MYHCIDDLPIGTEIASHFDAAADVTIANWYNTAWNVYDIYQFARYGIPKRCLAEIIFSHGIKAKGANRDRSIIIGLQNGGS